MLLSSLSISSTDYCKQIVHIRHNISHNHTKYQHYITNPSAHPLQHYRRVNLLGSRLPTSALFALPSSIISLITFPVPGPF